MLLVYNYLPVTITIFPVKRCVCVCCLKEAKMCVCADRVDRLVPVTILLELSIILSELQVMRGDQGQASRITDHHDSNGRDLASSHYLLGQTVGGNRQLLWRQSWA